MHYISNSLTRAKRPELSEPARVDRGASMELVLRSPDEARLRQATQAVYDMVAAEHAKAGLPIPDSY